MDKRVVITGYHVLLPKVFDNDSFHKLLLSGQSSYKFQEELKELKLKCQVAGMIDPKQIDNYIHPNINSDTITNGAAGMMSRDRTLKEKIKLDNLHSVIKANFGFGNVNSAMVLQKPN